MSIRLNLTPSILSKFAEGSIIKAKVSDRIDRTHAVIDIYGKKISAEFTKGIPSNPDISLVLESKNGNTLYLRMAGPADLLGHFIISQDKLAESINYIKQYSMAGIPGIFELNKALIMKNSKHFKLFNLLRKMLKSDTPSEDILFLNNIIDSRTADLTRFLSAVFPGIFTFQGKEKNSKKSISELLQSIDFSNENGLELLQEILSYLSENRNIYGELFFFDQGIKSCRYIFDKNMILSIDLSSLGKIDILIRHTEDICHINFYCQTDDTLKTLRKDIKLLESELKRYENIKYNFVFYNMKRESEKIIEIISAIDINYQLSFKV